EYIIKTKLIIRLLIISIIKKILYLNNYGLLDCY
ncbi:unnamed protein product, partial [marine sediment metagenome]